MTFSTPTPTPPDPTSGLSVIIPARNEAGCIGRTLELLKRNASGVVPEVIVVDGGSEDATCQIVREAGASVVTSLPGRARQMNAGAAVATGGNLLFLHADTLVPSGYDRHIAEALSLPGVAGGAFGLCIDAPNRSLRFIEWCVHQRSRRLSLPYGDQGLFMSADTFRRLGGFVDMPIMEDYELVRRLRSGGRVVIAPACVVTSARRWLRKGVACATMSNMACVIGYHLGVSPGRLVRWRDACPAWLAHEDEADDFAYCDHGRGRADRQSVDSAADGARPYGLEHRPPSREPASGRALVGPARPTESGAAGGVGRGGASGG